MENPIIKRKFELSLLGCFKILLVYYLLVPFIVGLPFRVTSLRMSSSSHEIISLAIAMLGDILTNIIGVKLILDSIREKSTNNFSINYIRKFNFKILSYTILLFLGFFMCRQSSIEHLIDKMSLPNFVQETFERAFKTSPSTSTPTFIAAFIVIVISIAIIAPIFEEILMRGIILEGFLNKYTAPIAIIISSLIFGIIHLNIPQFINSTLLGLLLATIYYKTNSLILCIVVHGLNNMFAISLLFINFQFNRITFFVGLVIFVIFSTLFIITSNKIPYVDINFDKNNASTDLPSE